MNAADPTEREGATASAAALRAVVAAVGHDLNNHLATILGRAELALSWEDPDRWRAALDAVARAGDRARVLVADLQRLAQWSAPDVEPAPLGDVLSTAVRLAARSAQRSSVRIVVSPSMPPCRAHRPAAATLAVWGALRAALAASPGEGTREWRLSADDESGLTVLAEADRPLDPAAFAEAARLGGGVRLPLATLLDDAGASHELDGPRLRLRF